MDQLQLQIARKVLPEPPADLHGWSVAGGGLTIGFESVTTEGRISARMPTFQVRDGMHVVVPVNLPEGGGYDVVCEVSDRYYRDGLDASVELAVLRVERRKPVRSSPRAALNELCLIRRVSHGAGHAEFEGKVVDLSTGGAGISTDRPISPGDRLEIATHIGRDELRCSLIVLYTEPATFGRYRSGCRMTSTTPHDDRVIAHYLDAHAETTGTPSLRRQAPQAA